MVAASGEREGGRGGESMAALARLQARLSGLREEYFRRNRSIDEDRKIEYKAAVKIQSWFRGCRVRAYLRYLTKMVIFIQKWWRGYRSRRYFRKMVETAYFIMKMNFYNEMAVRIQKRWRGYYVRKYIHNYYALKKYLEAISVNNEIVRKLDHSKTRLKKSTVSSTVPSFSENLEIRSLLEKAESEED
ncbi:spermatogenesis-associated protein 17 [Grus japonensis]|uniref:Spermatogenesis-associated protein 17 n=1 Tax=Grus japonensis TaxID=30415 RepID=A0ABC9WPR8_GRUJA